MNTTENNKLIAEFLGAKLTDQKGKQKPIYYPILGKSVNAENLKFHSDWNWLMEVVEKIKNIVSLMEIPYTNELISGLITVNKEAVYNACVEFIKWYNQQKK